MQIKKSPRDADYTGVPRFENATYENESDGSYDANKPDAFQSRSPRPAAPGTTETGDRTQQAARSVSVIDKHSSFDGQFETEHDLRVEGTISGEVICRGLFIVEPEATARSRVQARDAHIHGRLEGDIVCSGKLHLAATAHVTGTLKAALLVVEEGAKLSGTVDTIQSAAQSAAAPRPQAVPADSGNGREPAPATVTRASRRDLPSFAIVASDERPSAQQN